MSGTQWDLFLAHASADLSTAERLYDVIGSRACVFLDSRSLVPGDLWDEVVPAAQRESLITVVLVSPYTDRAWFQREEILGAIDLARSDGRRVVPVLLGGAEVAALPFGLRRVHAARLRTEADLAKVAEQLVELVHRQALQGPSQSAQAATAQAAPAAPAPAVAPPHDPALGVPVFVLSASGDRDDLADLRKHLYLAEKSHLLHIYTLDEAPLGAAQALGAARIEQAKVLVPLVSPKLFTEHDGLLDRMLAAYDGGGRLVPVLLRDTDLTYSRLRELVALPRERGPIARWADRDAAFTHVAIELRKLCEALRKP